MNFKIEWMPSLGPVLTLTIHGQQYGLCFCHHIPERSIRFFGLENYLCARCLGMLFGIICGFILLFTGIRINILLALLLLIPLVLDGFWQVLSDRESTNKLRLITGYLCGISAPFLGFTSGTFIKTLIGL